MPGGGTILLLVRIYSAVETVSEKMAMPDLLMFLCKSDWHIFSLQYSKFPEVYSFRVRKTNLPHYWSDTSFKNTVVNQALLSFPGCVCVYSSDLHETRVIKNSAYSSFKDDIKLYYLSLGNDDIPGFLRGWFIRIFGLISSSLIALTNLFIVFTKQFDQRPNLFLIVRQRMVSRIEKGFSQILFLENLILLNSCEPLKI